MKIFPIRFEILDDDNQLVCSIEQVDEYASVIKIHQPLNLSSWIELEQLVRQALQQQET